MNSATTPVAAGYLAALQATAARLDLEPRPLNAKGEPTGPLGGWLCRAVAEPIERDISAQQAAARTVADNMADTLISGRTGLCLLAELWRRFGGASRAEVFHGTVNAITILQADTALAEIAAAQAAINRVAA